MHFNDETAIILRRYNTQEGKEVFPEDLIKRLIGNDATFKEMSEATKVIEDYVKRLNTPPSRMEIYKIFTSKLEFNQTLLEIIFPVINEYVSLKEFMIERNLITQAELDDRIDKKQAALKVATEVKGN